MPGTLEMRSRTYFVSIPGVGLIITSLSRIEHKKQQDAWFDSRDRSCIPAGCCAER